MNITNLIHGVNTIVKIINQKPDIIEKLYILKLNNKTKYILKKSKEENIPIIYVTYIKNEKLKYLRKYYAIICKIKNINHETTNISEIIDKEEKPIILILDRMQDPHNFAACLRTAEAFSVKLIITTEKHFTKNSSLISRISNGANINSNIIKTNNIYNTIDILKKRHIPIIGLSAKATNIINDNVITPPVAILIGSEKNGLTKSAINLCDNLYKIPLNKKSKNINVSVAVGITLAQIKNPDLQMN